MMNPRWRLAWLRWLAVTAATLLLFNLFPQIDLAVSAALHDAAAAGLERFPLGQAAPVQALYHAVPWLGRLALIIALVQVLRRDTPPRPRRQATAVLLMLVLGLWLTVNVGLKDQWGRPRPVEISAFGGLHDFMPAGQPGGGCERNCSFVSGHAATGFALAAVGLLGTPARRRRWQRAGLATGLLIGAGRVLQGGHFTSDIVCAGLAMHLCALLIRQGWVLWRRYRADQHRHRTARIAK